MNLRLGIAAAACLAAFSLAQPAHAGLYLEPYIGYGMGDSKQGTSKDDVKGMAYGGRIGYSVMGLAVGVDYMTGKLNIDSTPSAEATPKDLGIFVGYTFPIMVRAYGVYVPTAKADMTSSSGDGDFEGSGMRLGVGFTMLPFVVINLEYTSIEYDKFKGNSLTNKNKLSMYGLNLSVPFDF